MTRSVTFLWLSAWSGVVACALVGAGCGEDATQSGPEGGTATGGVSGTGVGGLATGGVATGGAPSGGTGGVGAGVATGGAPAGGTATGGTATGGLDPTGGVATGGMPPTGGVATGGIPPTGGVATGGDGATGGVTTGGAATGGLDPTGGATPTGGGGTGGGRDEPWRIAPLGDSITETTCYPKLLSQLLIDEGRANFVFVGSSLNNQACGNGVPNVYTEGHGGYLVTQLLPGGTHATELPTWCSDNQAEIVLMHFGTNDTWNSTISTDSILEAFSVVLDAHRAANPDVIFFVAQIIPNAGCSTCNTSIPELNAAIVTWAAAEQSAASPIHVVDQFTGFDPVTDTGDGTHPNVTGSQKMAQRWADALGAQGLL